MGGAVPGDAAPGGVRTAVAGARTEQEFFARLADMGVVTRKRYSTTSPMR
jgi:hypothetical protein